MTFYNNVTKGLKLKVRKFLGLIPTFVEVAGLRDNFARFGYKFTGGRFSEYRRQCKACDIFRNNRIY